jgi:LysM repeat protein
MYRKIVRLLLVIFVMGWLASPAAADTLYVVQRGDTLASIARRYHTTIGVLMQLNNISNPNIIYVGQQLLIPDNKPGSSYQLYTVQRGDTLKNIATRYNSTVSTLAQLNQIVNINVIYVGQVLLIPATPPLTLPAASPTPVSTPAATPQPTATNPAVPTFTPLPTATPTTAPPVPVPTGNLLPNPSFEGSWYHPGNVPELQIPADWRFEWDEGSTGFGNNPWDVYLRPEVRVLAREYLPPAEHSLFIFGGNKTVKVFKGSGAVSFRLLTEVTLTPGRYQLEINLFPDLVMAYENGQKVWADDFLAGEVKLQAGASNTGWLYPTFGQKNTLRYTFTISQTQTISVGAAVRGRFALLNNGWFLDEWSLYRLP